MQNGRGFNKGQTFVVNIEVDSFVQVLSLNSALAFVVMLMRLGQQNLEFVLKLNNKLQVGSSLLLQYCPKLFMASFFLAIHNATCGNGKSQFGGRGEVLI